MVRLESEIYVEFMFIDESIGSDFLDEVFAVPLPSIEKFVHALWIDFFWTVELIGVLNR